MRSLWSEVEARRFADEFGPAWGEDLALRTYSARLLGADPALVLHGGGNTSVKGLVADILGERRRAIFVKASGAGLATIQPGAHLALDLEPLLRLEALADL